MINFNHVLIQLAPGFHVMTQVSSQKNKRASSLNVFMSMSVKDTSFFISESHLYIFVQEAETGNRNANEEKSLHWYRKTEVSHASHAATIT